MHPWLTGIFLTTFLLSPWLAPASEPEVPPRMIGTLGCNILPDSGVNLLIHSTKDIRCEFAPAAGGKSEHYKGETGIEFGIDASLNKRTNIAYSVLADHFSPASGQLAGKYTGAGGGISLGISVGESAPLRKNGGNISLQPIRVKNTGSGAAAGFTYLYLEEETK